MIRLDVEDVVWLLVFPIHVIILYICWLDLRIVEMACGPLFLMD